MGMSQKCYWILVFRLVLRSEIPALMKKHDEINNYYANFNTQMTIVNDIKLVINMYCVDV